jgi:hypothetical protein
MQTRLASHPSVISRGFIALAAGMVAQVATAHAQRGAPPAPAAVIQGFDPAECRDGCSTDTISLDVTRGRRGAIGDITLSFVLIDTLSVPKRGAPPAPRERAITVIVLTDSAPTGATSVSGRSNEKRIDDERVVRRALITWPVPAALASQLVKANAVTVLVDRRAHAMSATSVAAMRPLLEFAKAGQPPVAWSARALLHIATAFAFGAPGDSALAEDVGTATEPLMIPTSNTTAPTRVATLNIVGRGMGARAVLVQDDATGAAPIFGVNETVAIALPGRTGRRGVISGKVTARQRVEAPVDTCAGTKYWTYLVALSATDLSTAQRGMLPSTRPGDLVDRWNGSAVREAFPVRQTAAEARLIGASRAAVAQLVKDNAATGLRDRDVQVLAALPRGAGFVTNFGVIAKDAGSGGWRSPALTLRTASCR